MSDSGRVDPGLQGAEPFRFACQRSGRCCRVGAGYVWLQEADGDKLAAALGISREVFWRDYTRQVPDPRTGDLRRALSAGVGLSADRCRLLEGHNECSVYEARHRVAKHAAWDMMARVINASRDEQEGVEAATMAAKWMRRITAS